MKGIFVTGTDTNVGKTIVSAVLMIAFREEENVCYWKPIQTGIEHDNDTSTVVQIARCRDSEIFDQGIRLERPWSPHLSARLAGVSLTVKQTFRFIADQPSNKYWIVEGAGGPLVPINDEEMMIDLSMALNLPVVVVARSTLGTINHTLLTLEALRNRGLTVAGVVINQGSNNENRKAIEQFGNVKVLAEVPEFDLSPGDDLRIWAEGNVAAFTFDQFGIEF